MSNEWHTNGSDHYKTGSIEPIDLYKSGGMFQDYALTSIIKYAFRNRASVGVVDYKKALLDMKKIKDLADKLTIYFKEYIPNEEDTNV